MATVEGDMHPTDTFLQNRKPLDVSQPLPMGDQGRMAGSDQRTMNGTPTTAEKVAANALQTSDMIAGIITRTAENAILTLNSFADDRIERTVPTSRPPVVPETWKSRSSIGRSITSVVAVGMTKTAELVGKACFAIFKLMVALYYQIASMRGHQPPPLTEELKGIAVVATATLLAYVRVYDAVEQAATAVFTTLINDVSKYLSHKHGMHVAEVVRELVGIAQDLILSVLMWWRIALRAVISDGAVREANKFLAAHVPLELLRTNNRQQAVLGPSEGLQGLHRD